MKRGKFTRCQSKSYLLYISTLPLSNPLARCNSSINQEASVARRRTWCAPLKNIQQTLCTHRRSPTAWQALRFHPVLRRCLKGFITVTAPLQQASPPPPFSSCSLSEVSFFPLLVPLLSLLPSGVLLRVPLRAHSRGLAPITAFTSPRSVHQG